MWSAIDQLVKGTYDPDALSQPWLGEVRLMRCARKEATYVIKFRPLVDSELKQRCKSSAGFWIIRIHTMT